MVLTGWPASAEAIKVCRHNAIDISAHASSALTTELIRESDLIYVMSPAHRQHLLRLCPDSGSKCFLLADEQEVPDPIGQDLDFYEKCFAMIEQAIAKRIGELNL